MGSLLMHTSRKFGLYKNGNNLDDMIKNADKSMYEAKMNHKKKKGLI